MKECHFEQLFAIFGIYSIYFKKLGKIKMDSVTIAPGKFCWHTVVKFFQELWRIEKWVFGSIQLKCSSI